MTKYERKWLVVLLVLHLNQGGTGFRCDRRPYGSTTQASAPDGRFSLVVADAEDSYIPDQLYTVQLTKTDGESHFTAFMVSVEGDIQPDPGNPRRMIDMPPGEIRPYSPSTGKYSQRCLNSVEQAYTNAKSSVEVYWEAPPTGSGCVTLRAMVAENGDAWYEDGGPLSKRLCEDTRQPDDVTPQLNYDCSICDEAKYEISFTGIWSRNTHPALYPENDAVPKFSDLVGASHDTEYVLWSPGTLAKDGLKDLAEYANSTQFQTEIKEKIGSGVRTLVKGKGHGYKKMTTPTYAFLRADKTNHLVTVAIGLYPSPDWFLGVTRFELCSGQNTWLDERELNLYPWDAGTDSGVSYESPNLPTYPQDAISRVPMSSYDKNSPFYELDLKDVHPFGTLRIKLVKTYHRECEEATDEGETETKPEDGGETEDNPEPEDPSSESPIVMDPEASEDCPLSQWQEWSECEGPCEDGKISGYRSRERYHLVNGVPVEKYDPDLKPSLRKPVSDFCKASYETFETEACEEDCDEDGDKDLQVGRRVMVTIAPGRGWTGKRDLNKNATEPVL